MEIALISSYNQGYVTYYQILLEIETLINYNNLISTDCCFLGFIYFAIASGFGLIGFGEAL